MPPSTADLIPEDLILADATIPAGAYWTRLLPRWATLRVTDIEGRGAASLLVWNARQPSERYNAPDTTKVQNMIFLTTGWLLLSDLGRVLLSITGDTSGHHETLAGGTTPATVLARYGADGTYFEHHNDRFTNDRDNFIAAVGRHGLDERDLVPNVNLFAPIETSDIGALRWLPGVASAGSWIDLRAEQDVLVANSAAPYVKSTSSSRSNQARS